MRSLNIACESFYQLVNLPTDAFGTTVKGCICNGALVRRKPTCLICSRCPLILARRWKKRPMFRASSNRSTHSLYCLFATKPGGKLAGMQSSIRQGFPLNVDGHIRDQLGAKLPTHAFSDVYLNHLLSNDQLTSKSCCSRSELKHPRVTGVTSVVLSAFI